MDYKLRIIGLAMIGLVVISGAYIVLSNFSGGNEVAPPSSITTTDTTVTTTEIVASTSTKQQQNEGVKRIIPLDRIRSGGPPKDGIPSIDNPKFVDPNEADFLTNDDVVVGINYNGIVKAYPLQILVWHEIVNDMFGDTPLVITYCPLCYSSITFIRVLNGQTVEFGTSGRLYNSDLVMYDRQPGNNQLTVYWRDLTDAGNLWSQMLGQALVGELAAHKLTRVPTDILLWKDWLRLHPDTIVLSRDTGFLRNYGTDPYEGYFDSPTIWFPVEHRDDRLFEKEVIYGIEYEGKLKAYPVQYVDEKEVVNDIFQNRGIFLLKVGDKAVRGFESNVDGDQLTFEIKDGQIIDQETTSVWDEHGRAIEGPLKGTMLKRVQNGHIAFWFAWVAFYPMTEVFE